MQATKGVVTVIGGSRGIGAAAALKSAQAGYDVGIVYRSNAAAADRLVSAIRDTGRRAQAVRADVAQEPDILRAFAELDGLGPLVGLVNSAGINGGTMRVEHLEKSALDALFGLNVVGLMLCCREAVKRMARSHGGNGGAIVNISSMAATIGGRGKLSHYAASKGAVDVFTVGAAKELAPEGIRVFSLRPGATETDMTAEMSNDPQIRAAVERTIAVGRLANTDDIAGPIVRLLDPDMAYLSGARIDAGGGGLVF